MSLGASAWMSVWGGAKMQDRSRHASLMTNVASFCDSSPARKLLTMSLGIVQTQLLNTAAQLNLADHLKNGPQSTAALAEAANVDPSALGRLMATLVYIGVFEEKEPGYFSCTSMGALLQRDAPNSMRDIAMTYGGQWFTNAWP